METHKYMHALGKQMKIIILSLSC